MQKFTKKWEEYTKTDAKDHRKSHTPICNAIWDECQGLLITRHLGKNQRYLDPDSVLRGNAKQLVDSLIEIGVAPDDSIKHLKFVIGLQSDKHRELGPYTSVEVFS